MVNVDNLVLEFADSVTVNETLNITLAERVRTATDEPVKFFVSEILDARQFGNTVFIRLSAHAVIRGFPNQVMREAEVFANHADFGLGEALQACVTTCVVAEQRGEVTPSTVFGKVAGVDDNSSYEWSQTEKHGHTETGRAIAPICVIKLEPRLGKLGFLIFGINSQSKKRAIPDWIVLILDMSISLAFSL